MLGKIMAFSRRNFLLGLSAAGAVIPGAYYAQRELRLKYGEKITSGEATAAPATDEGAWLAHRLRGIWDIEFSGADAGLKGLPLTGVELHLDVGPTGRGLRGYLGLPETLRGDGVPEYRVLGDLVTDNPAEIRWRLIRQDSTLSTQLTPTHECTAILDEVWSNWGGAGSATLSGHIQRLDRAPQLPERDCVFVAHKRAFPNARERVPLNEGLLGWLVSSEHRLFHQLWHASRDKWHELSRDRQDALRGLGWQPGTLDKERDARGDDKHRNGSGEDFFFMHRHMLHMARSLQPNLIGWSQLPLPAPFIEQDRQGFIRYYDNYDGSSVPPAWESDGDPDYTQWVQEVKSSNTFYSNYQVWESQYQDPEYLSRLTLAEFGSELELGMHDWLHMRWATVTRDPTNGMPVTWDRDPSDFSERWFLPENDYLGDPFSSHVSPVFWMFHSWIDDRIEDWFRAHERIHPGEVHRQFVKGVPWFAPGRWVQVSDPWLGSSPYGCSPAGHHGHNSSAVHLDTEVMKLAISIIFSDGFASDLLKRAPRRPWYARHMKLNK